MLLSLETLLNFDSCDPPID